jgi:FimV-like protein
MDNFEDDVEANAALGSTYLQYADVIKVPEDKKQKLDSASIYLEQAQNIDPNDEATLSALGALNMTRGDYKTAAEYYEKYLNKNKTDDYGFFVYGYCNYQLLKNTGDNGYAKDAISAMQNSIRLNPQNGKGDLYMADCYMALGDEDEARKYLEKAIASGNPWLKEEQDLLNTLKPKLGIQ